MVSRDLLIKTSKWAGFIGIMNIIVGALQAFTGLFMYVIGAIPGIVLIVVGVKLRNIKKSADELIMLNPENQETHLYQIFANLHAYFKIQGVMLIILLVVAIITFFGVIWRVLTLVNGY